MAIETTFMRYGHGQSGIIGITLKPEILKAWAYSLHTWHCIMEDLYAMRDNEGPSAQTSHTGKFFARNKLQLCIDPADPEKHPEGLMNIVIGQVVNHPC